jgi:hypothetical protein
MRLLRTVILQLLIATWVAPCLAQTPAPGASSVEISFWESVKDSKDPAELQAYLDKYPNGTFSGLAKIRLDRLKKTPADEASVAATAPAPAPVNAAPSDPFPKAGDTWTYRYTDLWKPGDRLSVSHTVKRVGESEILDARSSPKGNDEFAYTAKPTVTQRAGGAYEFSPYHLLFMTLRPGEAFRLSFVSRDDNSPWSATVRVVANERVNVPAGEFDAVRVELKAIRPVSDYRSFSPTRMTQVIWYSNRVKRVVKYSVLTEGNAGVSDRDLYELASYTLN